MLADDFRRFAGPFRSLIILLAIFAIFYAVELTSFNLSIDDELASTRMAPDVWAAQGRWTVYLFEYFLMAQPVMPFMPIAIFGLLVSLAYIVLIRTMKSAMDIVAFLSFPFFIAFPVWFFLTEFQSNTPVEGLAVLLSALCVTLLANDITTSKGATSVKLSRIAIATLLATVAVGAYQSNLMLIITMGLSVIIFRMEAEQAARHLQVCFYRIILLFAVAVLSAVLYFIVADVFRYILNVTPAYTENFIQYDYFVRHPSKTLMKVFNNVWSIYSGNHSVYGASLFAFELTILFAAISIVVAKRPNADIAHQSIRLGLLIVMLLVPFALNPFNRGSMPLRSLVGVPTAIWFCAFVALSNGSRWISRAAAIITLLACLQILYVVNQYQAATALVRQRDATLAAAIYNGIAAANPGFDRTKNYKVAIAGAWPYLTPYPRPRSSTVGASFFEWDRGNVSRMITYMRLLGYTNLVPTQPATYAEAFAAMPTWPAEGAVTRVDEVTLVKLGGM